MEVGRLRRIRMVVQQVRSFKIHRGMAPPESQRHSQPIGVVDATIDELTCHLLAARGVEVPLSAGRHFGQS